MPDKSNKASDKIAGKGHTIPPPGVFFQEIHSIGAPFCS